MLFWSGRHEPSRLHRRHARPRRDPRPPWLALRPRLRTLTYLVSHPDRVDIDDAPEPSMSALLVFTLIGITVQVLPGILAEVKADIAAAKAADSPHGSSIGVDEVVGIVYKVGMRLAEAYAPAIAKAHGVDVAEVQAAMMPMGFAGQGHTPPAG